jgi:ArsR family transcriptional regulator
MPATSVPLTGDHPRIIEVAKALGDPARLRILARLPRTAECEQLLNVNELAQELTLPQSTVSRHLAILRRAGLVRSERMCRDVYYWADPDAIAAGAALIQGLVQAEQG